jgi:hypothetical protein
MTSKEKYELTQRIAALPLVEQLEFIEALVRNLRKANTDWEEVGRTMAAMAADPEMQRVLNNEDLEKLDAER